MKHLKTFKVFESAESAGLTKEQEDFLNKSTRGTWSYDSVTGLVDVKGDFRWVLEEIKDFMGIKFGKVSGNFDCERNQLTTLEGAPQEVGGNFICAGNKLTTLEGAPQKVGRDFECGHNKLTSLKGAPWEVKRNFNCAGNFLTSLAGAPQKVGGYFYCNNNRLKSLVGAPQKVGGVFDCRINFLTSLAGAPQKVRGHFNCDDNRLTSLAGAPQKVGGDFNCYNNSPTSLAGAPQKVGGYWNVSLVNNNPLTSLAGAPQEVGGGFICKAFRLGEGQWNPRGWLKVLQEGNSVAQSLILTLLSPEALNKEIAKDPAGMIMKLKDIWNDESFKEIRSKLVWPGGYEKEADLVGDLGGIGF